MPASKDAIRIPKKSGRRVTVKIKDKNTGLWWDMRSLGSLTLMVKRKLSDTDANAVLTKTIDLSLPIHDLENGTVKIDFTAAETALDPFEYVWDFKASHDPPIATDPIKLPYPAPFIIEKAVHAD